MKEPRFSEEGSLDRFENKLFNPKTKISDIIQHHNVGEINKESIPSSWDDNSEIISPKKATARSLGFSLLVLSLIILLFTTLFASWNIWQKRNVVSSASIDIVIQVKPYIEGGEESPLNIVVQNRNNITITDTNLNVSYAKGMGGQDQREKINNKISLGDIKQNEIKTYDEKIQLYGAEGEARTITVTLDYKVLGSRGVFDKTVTTDVILKTPPVSIHIDGPDHIASLQNSKYVIRVKNNGSKTADNILVTAVLPLSFNVLAMNPENKAQNMNAWVLSGLKEGEERSIFIEGSAKASIGEHINIKAQVGSQIDNSFDIGTVYSFDLKDIAISGSDLKFSFNTENDSGRVSFFRFGDKIKLALNYENISGRALDNVEIKGMLAGNVFDVNSVVVQNGEYDKNKKVILWNNVTAPELTNLAVNAKGTLYITFDISQTGDDKSFIRFDAQGSSVGADSAIRDVKTNLSQTWTVQGETSLTSQTIYVGSSFLNSGPIPPHIGIPTTYTIRLAVSSHKTLKKGNVSFKLPPYVTWLNKTSAGELISFDKVNRTVIWDISNLAGGQSKLLEVQVSMTPVPSHLGATPAITSGINFSSQESMNANYNIVNKALTIKLSDEEINVDKWVVVEK